MPCINFYMVSERASCWPVASSLVLARLHHILPHPILIQPSGYGDLLPRSGDDEDSSADNSDLLQPQEGLNDGDLPPQKRADQGVDDEGLLPPKNAADEEGFLLPKNAADEKGFLLPKNTDAEGCFLLPQHSDADGFLPRKCLLSTIENVINVKMAAMLFLLVSDPGGHLLLPRMVCLLRHISAMKSASFFTGTTNPSHSPHVGGATTLKVQEHAGSSILDSFCCNTNVGSDLQTRNVLLKLYWADCVAIVESVQHAYISNYAKFVIYLCGWIMGTFLHGVDADAICRFAEVDDHQPGFHIDDMSHFVGLSCGNEDGGLYGHNCDMLLGVGVITHFLIPLRRSNSDQWNDEVENEDVANSKKKTLQRRTAMRLSYLKKDLLDPG